MNGGTKLRRIRWIARVLAAVVAAVLLVASCGDSKTTSSSTTTAAPKSTTTTTAPKSTTTATAHVFTDAGLEALLVPISEVPSGYSVDTSQDDTAQDTPMCGNQLLGTLPHTGKAEVTYLGGQAGPLLTETLNSYESVDQASAVLNAARAAVKSCPKFDQTDKDGTVTHYTAAPLSFDKLADDQYAARLSFESTVGSGTADVFVAQRQNVIVFTGGVSVVSILGPAQIQPGDFLRFTKSAVTRVDEAS